MNEVLILVSGLLAGLVGSIGGGGGAFIPLFVLLNLGLPTQLAIGTTKLGNLGFFPATVYNYSKVARPNWNVIKIMAPLGVLGAIVGSFIVISTGSGFINKLVAILLLIVLFSYFLNKEAGIKESKGSRWWVLLYFFKAIYGGIIGAGSGLFSTAILVHVRGMTIVQTFLNKQVGTILGGLVSIAIFAWAGFVNYQVGLILFCGNLIGSFFGSKIAITKGNKFIRLVIMVMIAATIVRLLFFA